MQTIKYTKNAPTKIDALVWRKEWDSLTHVLPEQRVGNLVRLAFLKQIKKHKQGF